MKIIAHSVLASGFVAVIALAGVPAVAAPAMAPAQIVTGDAPAMSADKVAYRRVYRGAPPRAYARRRGVGPAVGLGIAAGVLGAIGAAAAANNGYYYGAPAYGYPAYGYPAYGYGCYISKQAAYDPWGNFAGWRRVRVCN